MSSSLLLQVKWCKRMHIKRLEAVHGLGLFGSSGGLRGWRLCMGLGSLASLVAQEAAVVVGLEFICLV